MLPVAIGLETHVELAVSRDGGFHFHSANIGETVHIEQHAPQTGFGSYLYGCVAVLQRAGYDVRPLCLLVRSDVPMGAGLSSSAALEVAAIRGMRALFGLQLDDVTVARLAQRAEVEFAGVRCGIMDQMAASLADREHMLFIDTRTLEQRRVPLPTGAAIVVLHSGVQRDLASSGYNERRKECEEAARLLGVRALRDVRDAAGVASLPAPLDRRARHVVSENARVLEGASGVDARAFGALMDASHASLRDDFEVSILALDRLVESLRSQPGVFGARLMGAGFGGACIALVRSDLSGEATRGALQEYARRGFAGHRLV